jgi:YHS domain-containing protein
MKPLFIFSSLVFLLSSCNKQKATTASAPSASPASASTDGKAKPYPLETCIVSGEKLGEMGDPVVIVHNGQEIKFCCEKCQPKFEKDPAKYLAKLSTPKP